MKNKQKRLLRTRGQEIEQLDCLIIQINKLHKMQQSVNIVQKHVRFSDISILPKIQIYI